MADTNVVQKDLGPVSAYAIAVKHGYKGTEEEWAALQIASAENAKAADASAKEAAETLAAVRETVEQETTAAVAAVNDQETASIQALKDTAQAAATYQEERIAVKGEQTLASIPDDYTKLGQDVAALTEEMAIQAPAIIETATGSMVTITDGAERPAVSLISHIEPVQEGDGDPSPDNVRPISGWDKVTAQRAGKNLCPVASHVTSDSNRTGRIQIDNIHAHGAYTLSALVTRYPDDTVTNARLSITILYTDGTQTKVSTPTVDANAEADGVARLKTVTVQSDSAKTIACIVLMPLDYGNFTPRNATADEIQFEVGSTATPYEPYQGQTLTADLPETVYGGTVDWNEGETIATCALATIDGTMVEAHGVASNGIPYVTIPFTQLDKAPAGADCGVCADRYAIKTTAIGIGMRFMYKSVYIYDDRFVDEETAKALLDAETPQVVYTLEKPYTIQLTPQELALLKGANNVWSDTGDTDLSYIADTKLYIDRKIAAIAAATV